MTGTILQFPTPDDRLAYLEPLGARLGYDLRPMAKLTYRHDLRDELTAWVSTVEDGRGDRWTRLSLQGFPTRHYHGEIDMKDAARKYWVEYGSDIARRYD